MEKTNLRTFVFAITEIHEFLVKCMPPNKSSVNKVLHGIVVLYSNRQLEPVISEPFA